MSSLFWGFIMWRSSGRKLETNWFKIAWHVVRVWMCFYFAPAMQSYLNMTRSDHTGSSVSPYLLILLDLCVHACTFYCMGQCVNVPRLLQHSLMVIKVDCVLRPLCNALHVHLWVVPWHAGMLPLHVPLLVQVLVTALSPPVIMYPGWHINVTFWPTVMSSPILSPFAGIPGSPQVITVSGGQEKKRCIRLHLKWCLWI